MSFILPCVEHLRVQEKLMGTEDDQHFVGSVLDWTDSSDSYMEHGETAELGFQNNTAKRWSYRGGS